MFSMQSGEPISADFKSEGEALVFLTNSSIYFEFPRTGLVAVESKQDGTSNYYYSKNKDAPRVRVGFDEDKLKWFFSKGRNWLVRITTDAQTKQVEGTPFSKMSDEQIKHLAEEVLSDQDVGGLNRPSVKRLANGDTELRCTLTAMGEDDPVAVGTAVLLFKDGANRSISIEAKIKEDK